ncbi:MAG: sigma-70 family RNA polymerase sigma factor [Bacteroidota bacterium]|nr:sigma-70 family RNA polymerase sigma factor [Bacteroidota bacterium]
MKVEEFKRDVLPVKDKLYRFALKMLRHPAEAEDTVQEVFLKLWSKREKLKEYKSIEAFAMVMTRNLCLDKLKSPGNRTNELLDSDLKVSGERPDKNYEMKDNITYVHRIIASLPEQQKMIMQLRDVEGYEFEEIAEIMQMKLNAIRVNLSRARKTVRDELTKKHNYEYTTN